MGWGWTEFHKEGWGCILNLEFVTSSHPISVGTVWKFWLQKCMENLCSVSDNRHPSTRPRHIPASQPTICFHDALQAGRQATSTHSVLAFSICDKMPQQPPLSSTCTSSASPVTEAGCRSPSTTTKLLPWADTSFVSFSTRTGWLVGRGCWVEFWWVSGTLHASHIKT